MRFKTMLPAAVLAAAAATTLAFTSGLASAGGYSPQPAPIDAGDSTCINNGGDYANCTLLHVKLHGDTRSVNVALFKDNAEVCSQTPSNNYSTTRENSMNIWIRKSTYQNFRIQMTDAEDPQGASSTMDCGGGLVVAYFSTAVNWCWDAPSNTGSSGLIAAPRLATTGQECTWN